MLPFHVGTCPLVALDCEISDSGCVWLDGENVEGLPVTSAHAAGKVLGFPEIADHVRSPVDVAPMAARNAAALAPSPLGPTVFVWAPRMPMDAIRMVMMDFMVD